MPTTVVTPDQILNYLPENSDKLYGWDEAKLEKIVDEFEGSLSHIMHHFWYERWSATWEFIDINEGGTSRALERIHLHAQAMLKYWDDKIKAEDEGYRGISFGEIAGPTEMCEH